jgi:hypothetical protein
MKRTKFIVIDSRDRDFTVFPNACDVVFTLSERFRNVKSISLMEFTMHFPFYPVLDPLTTVFLTFNGIHSIDGINVPYGIPQCDGVVMAALHGFNNNPGMETDGLYLYQTTSEHGPDYTISFPNGYNMNTLHVQLYYYNRSVVPGAGPGSMDLLTLGFNWFANQNAFSKESNWHGVFKIEFSDDSY